MDQKTQPSKDCQFFPTWYTDLIQPHSEYQEIFFGDNDKLTLTFIRKKSKYNTEEEQSRRTHHPISRFTIMLQ